MRVFAGLPFPGNVTKQLADWLAGWRNQYRNSLGIVKPENIHITLYFFGELKSGEVNSLISCMDKFHAKLISASLGPLSCFPDPRRPRVFYIGLNRGRSEVIALYQDFLKLITPLGYHAERNAFTPHATFARNKHMTGPVVFPGFEPFLDLAFTFDRMVLFESRLNPSGAEYIPLKIVSLN